MRARRFSWTLLIAGVAALGIGTSCGGRSEQCSGEACANEDGGHGGGEPTGGSAGAGGASGAAAGESGEGEPPWRLTCGNATVDPGEACDDGNTASGDGCSATCCVELTSLCCESWCITAQRRPCHCGDGYVDVGEECDDGNLEFGDGCSGFCELETPSCPNGEVDADEDCDDGNFVIGDGCDPGCRREPRCSP